VKWPYNDAVFEVKEEIPERRFRIMSLTIVDRFCKNGEVNLQYLDNGEAHENPLPLLIVPGAIENADDYLPFLQTLRRRVVALTLRGRYPSEAPASRYSVEDHAGDIAALVKHLALEHFALYAFSRGVSCALAFHSFSFRH